MIVLILGIDGYIGHSLTSHLLKRGHQVVGIDDLSRRQRVSIIGSDSLTTLDSFEKRGEWFRFHYEKFLESRRLDVRFYGDLRHILHVFRPDTIVHLAEIPSAPWSMQNFDRSMETQEVNTLGTLSLLWAMKAECPEAHLVKLGTMGEYGTPHCDLPEGRIPDQCSKYEDVYGKSDCPMGGLLFPRTPGSFYHASKVHDTYNINFACRIWGFRSTDIMQGVVYGLNDPQEQTTRFDYDECWGTVINRFAVQAIAGIPLTIYGVGGQTRGYLPLQDSLQCLTLAIENPPENGQYRTFNQFEKIYSVNSLADLIKEAALNHGIKVEFNHLINPRIEAEVHYYNPTCEHLYNLGFKPINNDLDEVTKLIDRLIPFKSFIKKEVIQPKTNWR